MAKRRREPPSSPVETEVEGKRHTGTYVVERGMIRVSSDFGFEETQLGNMPPEALAKMLLGELVAKKSKKS